MGLFEINTKTNDMHHILSSFQLSIGFFDIFVQAACAREYTLLGGYCIVKQNGSEPGFSNHIISFY